MSTSGALVRTRADRENVILSPQVAVMMYAAAQLRLLSAHLEMVRNFHRLALIPWLHWTGIGAIGEEERQSVIEIERDGRIGIDLKFGTITFKEEAAGSYAIALVDVIIGGKGLEGTRVQMEVKVAADPETDSILGVTETCRTHIVATLRAAADTFDTTTARALLFHEGHAARS